MASSTTTTALLRHGMIREITAARSSTASAVWASGRGRPSTVSGARRRRLMSSSAAAAADNPHNQLRSHPVIASRRSLDRLRRSESQSSGSGTGGKAGAGKQGQGQGQQQQKTKSEWPRSVRIGGYAAASMLVPYVLCSLVAELPGVRRFLEGDRPHDPTDHRLGKSVVEFVRRYWGEGRDGLTFPGEDDADVRRTQTEIERVKDRAVRVEVSVGDGDVRRVVGRVDGDVLLSSEVEIMRGVGLEGDGDEGRGPILVDFVDESEEESGGNSGGVTDEKVNSGADWTSTTTFSTEDDFASSLPSSENGDSSSERDDAARQLRELTHTYSSWHHFPPAAGPGATPGGGADAKKGGTTTGSATASELKISELEWREARLQGQLIDPNCTRDIDDMQAELAEVRRELRSLRGWRWKPW